MAKFKIKRLTGKERERGKGIYPIYLEAYHKRKRKLFYLEYECKESEWSESKSEFKGKFKSQKDNIQDCNDNLRNTLRRCERIKKEITEDGSEFSLSAFAKRYRSKDVTDISSIIELKKSKTKGSTYKWYQTAQNALDNYEENILLSEFTNEKLELFIKWLKTTRTIKFKTNEGNIEKVIAKPLKNGGVNSYLRAIRAAYNFGIAEDEIPDHYKPNFDKYIKIHKTGGKKRSLPKSVLDKIFNLEFEDKRVNFANEVFQLSLLLRGINFADLIELRPEHIQTVGSDKRLLYKRRKVKTEFDLRINSTAMAILEKHMNDPLRVHRGYILPVLDQNVHTTDKKILNRKKHYLNKYINKYLKGPISEALGLENFDFTSYVARHSYASTLKAMGKSTEVISNALGHRDTKTTKNYLVGITDYSVDKIDKELWGE